ncbi:hypothetical protein MFLAVUS_010062 [Mucor flavus]|uniref:Uncharacterized protein n=1 Tax=Mucor flavus TaxID=439312 RepID=A0ABP9ZBN0_9FUNG
MNDGKDTLCILCGDYFVGDAGLKRHRTIATKCIRTQIERGVYVPPPQVQVNIPQVLPVPENVPPVPPVPENVLPVPGEVYAPYIPNEGERPDLPPNEGGDANLIDIEGYSLSYLTIPADLFQNLQNEQLVDGRYRSLIQFAENATATQRQKQSGVATILFKSGSFIISSVFWGSRLGCIGFMGYAFYYSYIGECSASLNYIIMSIKKTL